MFIVNYHSILFIFLFKGYILGCKNCSWSSEQKKLSFGTGNKKNKYSC